MSDTCYVGIDLGSTTTKAVVLDEQHRVLGRGITNSRSNYDLACDIAQTEAFVDAQMSRLKHAFESDDVLGPHAKALGASVGRSFRYRQHIRQLDTLERECMRLADANKDLVAALERILVAMREDAERLYSGLMAPSESEFFRDIAGSLFQRLAEGEASPKVLPYESIVGVFDRAILVVENEPDDLSFEGNAKAALSRSLERYQKADERVREAAMRQIDDLLNRPFHTACSVGTGYGRARLPFPKAQIRSEILCHGLGAHIMYPGTRTVLDIGGQDTKGIQVDEHGIVTSFQMNDRCAAGCGRYLGYIADEMNLGVHELGPLAQQAKKKVKISSTCTVFAGAELRERLSLGEKREDILAGLHRAIILRAMSILARSGGVEEEFTFTGGVARNQAAVKALRDLIHENYGERTINISPASIYMGALGAAHFAKREADQIAAATAAEASEGAASETEVRA